MITQAIDISVVLSVSDPLRTEQSVYMCVLSHCKLTELELHLILIQSWTEQSVYIYVC